MAYTVKKLAVMSGVSVRTLHFYDEVGLLEPAYLGANGYRYYEEPQLLILQQILFYRELGFELRKVKKLLKRTNPGKIAELQSHRKVLRKRLTDTQALIQTIDKTIRHLKGTMKMNEQELFDGFSPEQQAKHERYLIDRFGDGMEKSISDSKARVKNWTKARWEKSSVDFALICRDLVVFMERGLAADSREVQSVIRCHFEWMKQFWTPTRESYSGHSQLIVDSTLRKAYEAHHSRLPEFAAAAIKDFSERELS